jgi:hypothetical protein
MYKTYLWVVAERANDAHVDGLAHIVSGGQKMDQHARQVGGVVAIKDTELQGTCVYACVVV